MIKPLLKFVYRSQYIAAPFLNHNRPVDVSLELASLCNQACSYCYHADQKTLPFQKGMMSERIAKLIILDAAYLGVPSIKFNYRGESTLNPHFEMLTEFAKDHAGKYTFQERITNSNFKFSIDRDDIFRGLCNQTKVKVSFDSFVPGVMEEQRAGSSRVRAMANITKFYNMDARKDTELVIQSVRTKLNANEDIAYEVKKLWPSAKVSIRDMVGGRVKSEKSDALENKSRDLSGRKSCIQAHARLIFNFEGKAQICCPDIGSELTVGDISTDTLSMIFNSPKAKEIRKRLKDKTAFQLSPCKNCSSFESYKGYSAPWGS